MPGIAQPLLSWAIVRHELELEVWSSGFVAVQAELFWQFRVQEIRYFLEVMISVDRFVA